MLGIIIGVAAVIIIMAVGAGAQSLVLSQVKSLGSNLIGALPGKSEGEGPPASAMGIVVTTMTYDDIVALRDKKTNPYLLAVAGHSRSVGTLTWQENSYDTNLDGTTESYLEVEGGEVATGRFFNEEEEKNLARVVVLGSTVKKELFGESDAVGQRIKVKKQTLEVIGVMKERGKVAFQDYDDQVFVPLSTMQKVILGVNHIGLLRAKVDNENNVDLAIEDMTVTLREQHDIRDNTGTSDDFTVRSAAQALDILGTITNALRFFLTAMAAMSLVVGGIGIMNIMLVSVTERTREIGLRKAIGANTNNILTQFLIESSFITLLGGLIGIAFGVLVSFLVAVIAQKLGYSWDFLVSFFSIFLATTVSLGVGLIFGLYPARKASKLDPIEALRYE